MTDIENDELWNSYFYPGTELLINKFNCKNFEKLKELDASISFDKLLELNNHPLELNFDKEHLKAIHKFVFGDIYPFAGEYRKVNMRKKIGYFLTIVDDSTIDNYLDSLFSEVNNLVKCSTSKVEFAEALAKLYTGIIYCHPFREGNGRVTKEFVREFSIAKSNSEFELDWSLVDKEQLNQYIDVAHLYPGLTGMLFLNALVPIEKKINK